MAFKKQDFEDISLLLEISAGFYRVPVILHLWGFECTRQKIRRAQTEVRILACFYRVQVINIHGVLRHRQKNWVTGSLKHCRHNSACNLDLLYYIGNPGTGTRNMEHGTWNPEPPVGARLTFQKYSPRSCFLTRAGTNLIKTL